MLIGEREVPAKIYLGLFGTMIVLPLLISALAFASEIYGQEPAHAAPGSHAYTTWSDYAGSPAHVVWTQTSLLGQTRKNEMLQLRVAGRESYALSGRACRSPLPTWRS
jgi:hypothetical protein